MNIPVSISSADPTPLGPVWVAVSASGLEVVQIGGGREAFIAQLDRMGFSPTTEHEAQAAAAARQVQEYLDGNRQVFDFPINWERMPAFKREALQATCAVTFGQTTTYGEIARKIGRPRAARAVGRAEATNPMPLVIPCHRVLGTDGKLHGYGGGNGLATKAWLLKLEDAL